MKFSELKVGDKFKYNNTEYSKIPEVRISCCKVKHNCETPDGTKAALKPLDEVEKIENN
jgi:hypothetical protein